MKQFVTHGLTTAGNGSHERRCDCTLSVNVQGRVALGQPLDRVGEPRA